MAMTKGFLMAWFASLHSYAEKWQAEVLTNAGIDPRVCWVCGNAQHFSWEPMAQCMSCQCTTQPTERGQIILDAAKKANEPLSAEIRDGAGILVARFYQSKKYGMIWNFEQDISNFATLEELPSQPQGVKLVLPAWWPTEQLAQYDIIRQQQLPVLLAEAKAEASKLGVKVGRGHMGFHCEVCSEPICNGGKLYPDNPPCEHQGEHPEQILQRWLYTVQRRRAELEKAEQRQQKSQEAQRELEEHLALKGFFDGRLGLAKTPQTAKAIRISSMGSRSDPVVFLVAGQLTIDQLKELVPAFGNYSAISEEAGKVVLKTPHPAIWIGKKGSVVKHLSSALGRRIEVVKSDPIKPEEKPKPQQTPPSWATKGQPSAQTSTPAPKPVFRQPQSELDTLIEQMEAGQAPKCSCGGELKLTDFAVEIPSKPLEDRRMVCQSCGKKLEVPRRYLKAIWVKKTSGPNSEGCVFDFSTKGITTGSGPLSRRAKPEEITRLEKVLMLLQLSEAEPFKSGLAKAKEAK